jgi:hypothetical protein
MAKNQVLESQIIAGQELQQDEWKVLEDLLVKASMGNNKTDHNKLEPSLGSSSCQ